MPRRILPFGYMADPDFALLLPLQGAAPNSAFWLHGGPRFCSPTTPTGGVVVVGWWDGWLVGWWVGWRGGLNLRTAFPKGALVAEKSMTQKTKMTQTMTLNNFQISCHLLVQVKSWSTTFFKSAIFIHGQIFMLFHPSFHNIFLPNHGL